jgi:Tfp pilus assembly protein PilF
MLRKLYLYTNAYEFGNNLDSNYLRKRLGVLRSDPVSLYWVLPFAVLGLGVCARRFRQQALLYLFTVVYSATVVLFFVNDKFRMPVVPALCLFGAHGAFWLWDTFAARTWRAAWLGTLVLVACAAYTWHRPAGVAYTTARRQTQYALANASLELGDHGRAERELREILHEAPHDAVALGILGNLYLEQGRAVEADTCFGRAVRFDSTNVLALTNAAILRARAGKFGQSNALFERALSVHARDAKVLYLYARTLVRQEHDEKAVAMLRRAVEADPRHGEAHALLDSLLEQGPLSTRSDSTVAP